VCQPGRPLQIDDHDQCTDDACDPHNGVSHQPKAACAPPAPQPAPAPPPPPHLTAPTLPTDNPGGVNGTRPPR
jgi:hypothetical protein